MRDVDDRNTSCILYERSIILYNKFFPRLDIRKDSPDSRAMRIKSPSQFRILENDLGIYIYKIDQSII